MKTGFVYIWRDRKHKRHYIGSHWGAIDDGYICSSKWMLKAYKRRPQDFKRRILSIHDKREAMIDEENRLLTMIKPEETKIRYYNLNLKAWHLWHMTARNVDIKQKISETKKLRASLMTPEERKQKFGSRIGKPSIFKGKHHSEEAKEKLRAANLGKIHSTETKQKMSQTRLGKRHTEEAKLKMRGSKSQAHIEALKLAWVKRRERNNAIAEDG